MTLLPHVVMSESTRFHAPMSITWHRGEGRIEAHAPSPAVVSSDCAPAVDLPFVDSAIAPRRQLSPASRVGSHRSEVAPVGRF